MALNNLSQSLALWLAQLRPEVTRAPILLAVSGGSDSSGLLYAASCLSGFRFQALTVDHKLRPEAADEARHVGDICRALGISHHIRELIWPAGETPSQARSRQHRYSLIAAQARHTGAKLILTGHTEDDQAETCLIRRDAGSDDWGLAGMSELAPLPVWPDGEGLLLGRPFLGLVRAVIRSALSARGIGWVEDPSNENLAFARIRAREALRHDRDMRRHLLDDQARFARSRETLAQRLIGFNDRHLSWIAGNSVRIDFSDYLALPPESQFRLIAHVLPVVSGGNALPRRDKVETLTEKLRSGRDMPGLTLGGCAIMIAGHVLQISPETGAAEPDDISAANPVWRGRVRFTFQTEKTNLQVCPWGELRVPEQFRRADGLPFAFRKALPVIVDEKKNVLSVPHLEQDTRFIVHDCGEDRLNLWLDAKSKFFNA